MVPKIIWYKKLLAFARQGFCHFNNFNILWEILVLEGSNHASPAPNIILKCHIRLIWWWWFWKPVIIWRVFFTVLLFLCCRKKLQCMPSANLFSVLYSVLTIIVCFISKKRCCHYLFKSLKPLVSTCQGVTNKQKSQIEIIPSKEKLR